MIVETAVGLLMMPALGRPPVGTVPPPTLRHGCNGEPVCTLPPVPVEGERPDVQRPFITKPIVPMPINFGPNQDSPDDTFDDEVESQIAPCALEDAARDTAAEQAVERIENAESTRVRDGEEWVEHGAALYRVRGDNTIHLGEVAVGTRNNVSIEYPGTATGAAGGEVLGYVHTHSLHPVPSEADWAALDLIASRGDGDSATMSLYILHDGNLYQFTAEDRAHFTQQAGQPPVNPQPNSDQFARNNGADNCSSSEV